MEELLNSYQEERKEYDLKPRAASVERLLLNFFSGKKASELKNLTQDDIVASFNKFKISSKNSFISYRGYILDFLIWLDEKGYETANAVSILEQLDYEQLRPENLYNRYYFGSYKTFSDTLYNMFSQATTNQDLFYVSIVLTWFGFNTEDLIELKKTDVSNAECKVYRASSGEWIEIPQREFSVIRRCQSSSTYTCQAWNRIFEKKYAYSDYVFRSDNRDKLTKQNIQHFNARINRRIQEEDGENARLFVYSNIFKEGTYSRMIEYEKENGKIQSFDYDLIKNILRLSDDVDLIRYRFLEYQKYKEYFGY